MSEAEYINEICALRARLGAVEAALATVSQERMADFERAEAAEARLAEVEALCERAGDVNCEWLPRIRAAARGEDK